MALKLKNLGSTLKKFFRGRFFTGVSRGVTSFLEEQHPIFEQSFENHHKAKRNIGGNPLMLLTPDNQL